MDSLWSMVYFNRALAMSRIYPDARVYPEILGNCGGLVMFESVKLLSFAAQAIVQK